MKLYVWEGDGVLTDYTNGMIVAVANNLDQALAAIRGKCSHGMNYFPNDKPTTVLDLGQRKVTAQAFVCWGGG